MFCAVPARSPYLGEGSLAVVRVLQDPAGDCRISVESRTVYVSPGLYSPPVTSRIWIRVWCVDILSCKSYRFSAITDEAAAGVVISSLVQI